MQNTFRSIKNMITVSALVLTSLSTVTYALLIITQVNISGAVHVKGEVLMKS